MARARNIKPSFFTNDELADVPALGRLLFIALWTMADREGRLEDRPKRIKAEALPYDECDADELLDSLQSRGFILRYQIGAARFIQVVNFCKHQNPHIKEGPSQIPAPCESGASTVQERCEEQPEPEPARLIPDSGFPLPDSPIPHPSARGTEAGRACRLMRDAGVRAVNPSDPRLLKILSQGVTPEQLGDLAAELIANGSEPGSAAYVLKAMARRMEEAGKMNGKPPARASPSRADRLSATVAALTGRTPQAEVIDVTETASVRLG
ncbi:MAG: hypothetical protein KJZ57_00075 [Anaerolineales bacterium]|nr:hypothetical protein [Anaerolineales bacterium]